VFESPTALAHASRNRRRLLRAARQRQTTDTFQADYHKHRSGVEGWVNDRSAITGHGPCRLRQVSDHDMLGAR